MRRLPLNYSGNGRKTLVVSSFKGVDMTGAPSVVDMRRSPWAPNMVRDIPGKVRKRMGYYKVGEYAARINGLHSFRSGSNTKKLVHSGTELYLENDLIYEGMADNRSKAFQLCGRLYIADGKRLLVFDGEVCRPAGEQAYVPLITIGRQSFGGGQSFEPLNLLSSGFRERFRGDGESRIFQLSFCGLDSETVKVRVMDGMGHWSTLEGGYTVNIREGSVTFDTAPPSPPLEGADNLEVEACKTVEGYRERIDGCTVGAVFGVGGSQDRLFLSGNPLYPNMDFHSEMNRPDYFPDTAYSLLGQESCAVAGYLAVGDRLYTFKSRDDDDKNIVIRSGEMLEGRAVFPVKNLLSGAPAVSKHCLCIGEEPLFLSTGGVFAITRQDITGTDYSQNRSYYINRALTAEPNLEEAVAAVYKDYFAVAVGGKMYLLDLLTKEYQPRQPYSSFQYECYFLTGIDARALMTDSEGLCFGTEGGELFRFYIDPTADSSYNDDGEPIAACWTLPQFGGELFYKHKDMLNFSLKMGAAPVTSVEIEAKTRGVWRHVAHDRTACRYLRFSSLSFSDFTFCCDSDPRVISGSVKLKRIPFAALRFQNNKLSQPFSLLELSFGYRETAEIKRWK